MTSKKNILVTGGAGFIGSHLCEKLVLKHNLVVCLDNFDGFYEKAIKKNNLKNLVGLNNFLMVEGDIRNSETLDSIFLNNEIELVIHLAAKAGVRPSVENPSDFFDTNIAGTVSILEAMRKHKVQNLIFSSSSSVYGNNTKSPYSESDNVDHPISPYAATKKGGELLTHAYHSMFNLKVINLRFFTVYGPRQRPDLAIHKFIKKIYTNETIEIYGDGSTSRDYTYVDDTVYGIVSAIQYLFNNSNVYETVNLGNSNPVRLSELISLIEETTNKTFKKKYLPMQIGDVRSTFADISKAQELFNYSPSTNLKNGLLSFKNWYEQSHK